MAAQLTPLLPADLPAALRLSTQAGWNQLPMDWQRLFDLFPAGCLAVRVDGQVVGTATLATYGRDLGWVGMVLVDEAHRGQGHARTLLHGCLDAADRAGIPLLGLDATDLGRPVYLKLGFTDTHPITRWTVRCGPSRAPTESRISKLEDFAFAPTDLPALLALDRSALSIDRAPLLQHLISEPNVRTHVSHSRTKAQNSGLSAFGMLRPGRTAWHLGPVIAEDGLLALAVIASLLNTLPVGTHTVFLDALADPKLESALQGLGFQPGRRLMRMHRPAGPPAAAPSPYTIVPAGFELA